MSNDSPLMVKTKKRGYARLFLEVTKMDLIGIGKFIAELRKEQKLTQEQLGEKVSGSFSLKDKIEFYKRKWLKEHIAIMIFVGICILGIMIVGIVTRNSWLIVLAGLLIPITHGWRNNAMMTYVERNAYDGKGTFYE